MMEEKSAVDHITIASIVIGEIRSACRNLAGTKKLS